MLAKKRLLFLVIAWLLSAQVASANSWPPMAIWLLSLPMGAGIKSYGLGLLAIVLLESLIFARREKLPWPLALKVVTLANAASLWVGFLTLLGFGGLPYGIGWIPLILVYGMMVTFSNRLFAPHQPISLVRRLLRVSNWSMHWFAILFSGLVLLAGGIGRLNPATVMGQPFPDPSVPVYVNGVQLLAVIVFLAMGWTMSIITEGFCIRGLVSKPSASSIHTVLIMNLRSYTYIAIPITVLLLLGRGF
ncbi:MAG: hypothetical protein ACFB0C_08615 [Leptolyngbyaceae cyanobacterium]